MPTTTRKKSAESAGSSAAKSPSQKKPAKRKSTADASATVGRVLDEMKHGELRSGGDGKKVTDRKQAIAIGLSEAHTKPKK